MRKLVLFLVSVSLIIIIFGCGGTKQMVRQSSSQCEPPEWYLNPSISSDTLFATNTATSKDMQFAVDKSVAGARGEIARQVGLKVDDFYKRAREEIGLGEDAESIDQASTAVKQFVSTSLNGSKVLKKKVCKDAGVYRAYGLVLYPVANLNKAMLEQIKKDKLMYKRFRASEIFKELDEEAAKAEKNDL